MTMIVALLLFRLASDVVYDGKCEIVLSKDNITVRTPSSLEGSLLLTSLL